jgi:hypothetical protein
MMMHGTMNVKINIDIRHQTVRGFRLSIHNNSDEAV